MQILLVWPLRTLSVDTYFPLIYSHRVCVVFKHFINFWYYKMLCFHFVFPCLSPRISHFSWLILLDMVSESKIRVLRCSLLENPCFWAFSTDRARAYMYVYCVGLSILIVMLLARNAWSTYLGLYYLWIAPTDISPNRANIVAGPVLLILIIVIIRNISATTIQYIYQFTLGNIDFLLDLHQEVS